MTAACQVVPASRHMVPPVCHTLIHAHHAAGTRQVIILSPPTLTARVLAATPVWRTHDGLGRVPSCGQGPAGSLAARHRTCAPERARVYVTRLSGNALLGPSSVRVGENNTTCAFADWHTHDNAVRNSEGETAARASSCMLIACLMYSSPSRIPSLHPSTLPAHTACRKSSRSPSRLMIHTRCVSLDTPLSAVHAFSIEVHLGHTECISYHLTSMSMHVLPSLHPARFTPCRFCQSRRQVLATTPLILSECDSLACGRFHPFLIPSKTSEWWVALCETTSQSTQYEFRCVSLITTAPYSDDAECPIPTHAPS